MASRDDHKKAQGAPASHGELKDLAAPVWGDGRTHVPLFSQLEKLQISAGARRYAIPPISDFRTCSLAHFKELVISKSGELKAELARSADPRGHADVGLAVDLAAQELLRSFGNPRSIKESQALFKKEPCATYFERGEFHNANFALVGVARHGYGGMPQPLLVGGLIFDDIKDVALRLHANGYSSDVVVAAILLHTHNSLDATGVSWLHAQAQNFSPRVRELVQVVKSASPDPRFAPEQVSVLNFQRPPILQISPETPKEIAQGAKAIACASMLSPFWLDSDKVFRDTGDIASPHLGFEDSLALPISWPSRRYLRAWGDVMKESHIPQSFRDSYQLECKTSGWSFRSGVDPLKVRAGELTGSLDLLRKFFFETDEKSQKGQLLQHARHAAELALHLASEKAPLRTMVEGLTNPFFDLLSPGARERISLVFHTIMESQQGIAAYSEHYYGKIFSDAPPAAPAPSDLGSVTASSASLPEGQTFVRGLAKTLGATTTRTERLERSEAGFFSTLRLEEPSREDRCQALFESLQAARGTSGEVPAPLGSFISENRRSLEGAVLKLAEVELTQNLAAYASKQLSRRYGHDPREPAHSSSSIRNFFCDEFGDVIVAHRKTSLSSRVDSGLSLGEQASRILAGQSVKQIIQLASQALASHLPALQEVIGLEMRAHQAGATISLSRDAGIERVSHFLYEQIRSNLWSFRVPGEFTEISAILGVRTGGPDRQVSAKPLYSPAELRSFAKALDKMLEVFTKIKSTGNLRDRVESYQHVLEVGVTLALAGTPADVVLAGILHDLYEVTTPKTSRKGRDTRQKAEDWVRREFGEGVHALVDLVSETRASGPRERPPFLDRKMEIFRKVEQMHQDNPELARKAVAILLAAKVSTLGEGLRFFGENGETKPWSGGDYLDNLQVMLATRELAERLSPSHHLILALFDGMLEGWSSVQRDPSSEVYSTAVGYFNSPDTDPRAKRRAFELSRKLSEEGHFDGKLLLGLCYLHGTGVKANGEQGVRILEEALANWSPQATTNPANILWAVAVAYELGVGGLKADMRKALIYMIGASRAGSLDASSRITELCAQGKVNLPRAAFEEAKAQIQQQAERGDRRARAHLDWLAEVEARHQAGIRELLRVLKEHDF